MKYAMHWRKIIIQPLEMAERTWNHSSFGYFQSPNDYIAIESGPSREVHDTKLKFLCNIYQNAFDVTEMR